MKHIAGSGGSEVPGLLSISRDGSITQNPKKDWNEKYLRKVRWDNLYIMGDRGLIPLKIGLGQVLQHIGCPYAARTRETEIDYPVSISGRLPKNGRLSKNGRQAQRIKLPLTGCSFCDVATDKGFHGRLDTEIVISQLRCLPEAPGGRKIPFELINENPLPDLPDLMTEADIQGIRLSQVNLTLRADWFVSGIQHLRESLRVASEQGIYVLLSSIGFESFDDTILRNLNKGLSVEQNLHAIRLMRQLKEEFPHQLGYSTREGANHGLIHPTAWDTKEISARIQKTIYLYGLQNDILPPHSTPLIIHHASGLGDWIREIEHREELWFKRHGSIIGWWEAPHRF